MNRVMIETGGETLRVAYDPCLVEEAVLLALHRHDEDTAFHAERDAIYEQADEDAREAAFRSLHQAWFERLGLGTSIEQVLAEYPTVLPKVRQAIVALAKSRNDEGADLFVATEKHDGGVKRSIGIQLLASSLRQHDEIVLLLRHEFLHIADILDPAFGYQVDLPEPEGGPTAQQLVQDRYRVLWDVSIDGRLRRRGWAAPMAQQRRRSDFGKAFPSLGSETDRAFSRLFDGPRPSHDAFVSAALRPASLLEDPETDRVDIVCAVCGFPTRSFHPAPTMLSQKALDYLLVGFPTWSPTDGICLQCADLYESRNLSLQEMSVFPTVR